MARTASERIALLIELAQEADAGPDAAKKPPPAGPILREDWQVDAMLDDWLEERDGRRHRGPGQLAFSGI